MEKFTKEKDELLIDLVRCNAVLYDASEKEYKNNILKHRVWENISENLGIPVSDVKKRWKHLRDHYNKKKKADKGTGQTRIQNNWEYMSQLTFLSQSPSHPQRSTFINVEESIGTVNQEADDIEEIEESFQNQLPDNSVESTDNELHDQNINNSRTSEPSRRNKRKSNSSFLLKILKNRQDERAALYAKLSQPETTTPIKKFFDSMADIVSQFPPHLAAEARLKVCQVVTDIEIKMHTDQLRSVSTPVPSLSDNSNT